MGSFVDEFVIALGLDPSGVASGAKQTRDELKRTQDAADSAASRMESAGKRAANTFAGLKNEVVGLLIAFTGANGLKALAGDMIDTAATVGRLSDNIGVSTEDISVWQAIVQKAGGSASEAQGAMKQMAMVLGDMRLGLRPANSGILQALGINQDTAGNPLDMLLRIADASQRMDRLTFTDLASRLGFSDATIALLGQGRAALEKQLAAEQKLYVIHKKDADAAREFNASLSGLGLTIEGRLYPALTPLIEKFDAWLTTGDHAEETTTALIGGFGLLAVAALAPYAPIIAMGAAIGIVLEKIGAFDRVIPEMNKDLSTFMLRMSYAVREWEALKRGDWAELSHLMHQDLANTLGIPVAGLKPDKVGGTSLNDLAASAGRFLGSSSGKGKAGGRHVALDANNPGGINDGSFARSQPGYVGANGRYAAFDTLEHGEQAQVALLMSYIRRGWNTPASIASRWAPVGDGNNSAAYAAQIAKRLGIGVNSRISAADAKRFAQVQGVAENRAYRATGAPVSVGAINVYSSKADPKAVAAEIPKALQQRMRTTQADGAFN